VRVRDVKLEGGCALIQVYTGNGKGKTTAALGLALRASGAGLKVYIMQFAKGKRYSEMVSLKKIKNIQLEQCGGSCFITRAPSKKDLALARAGFKKAREAIARQLYDMVILDEINIAVKLKILKLTDIIALLKEVPEKVEVVLTGRYAHPRIIRLSDLTSEIREVKHYFRKNIPARKGIEF
jgi:cob(I)alamin adenosyltransferase